MVRRFVFSSIVAFAACARDAAVIAPRPPPAVVVPPAVATTKPAPLSLARLVEAVDDLNRAGDDRSHARIVAILRRLADALAEVPRVPSIRIERIRTLAADLEGSESGSSIHADVMVRAIDETVSSLAVAVSAEDTAARASYFAARTAADKLDRDAPLLQQTAVSVAAFEAIAEAIFSVLGTHRDALPETTPVIERDAQLFAKRTATAASLTIALASSRGWSETQHQAADVLEAIASALASAPADSVSIEEQASHVLAIRLEADRLRNADTLSFRRLDWAKHALSVAVDALEAIVGPDEPEQVLVDDARDAVEAIDLARSFEFQRAAIQDTTRLVVDSLRMLASTTRPVASR